MSGTATTNLPLSDSADDVIGNAAGSTIRVSMARLAALLGTLQGPAYGSVTQLQADTAWPGGAIGSVYGGTAAQIGVYRKSGAPGSGSWSRIGDLPVNSITAAQLAEKAALADLTAEIAYRRAAIRDAGIMPLANVAGRNSISATLTPSMIEGGATLANTSTVELIPAETSDGPVQLSLDGATPVPVRDAAGAELQVGALLAGRSYFLRRRGSTWRIIAGGVSSVEMRAEAQARMEGDHAEAQLRLAGDRALGVYALPAVGGSATAITAELGFPEEPGKTKVILVPAADNTGPVTLRLGTGPVRAIMSADSANLSAGDLKAGSGVLLRLSAAGEWRLVGLARGDIAAAVAGEATARQRAISNLRSAIGGMISPSNAALGQTSDFSGLTTSVGYTARAYALQAPITSSGTLTNLRLYSRNTAPLSGNIVAWSYSGGVLTQEKAMPVTINPGYNSFNVDLEVPAGGAVGVVTTTSLLLGQAGGVPDAPFLYFQNAVGTSFTPVSNSGRGAMLAASVTFSAETITPRLDVLEDAVDADSALLWSFIAKQRQIYGQSADMSGLPASTAKGAAVMVAPAMRVTDDCTLVRLRIVATSNHTAQVLVWNLNGTTYTIASSRDVPLVAGYNEVTLNIPVSSGQFLGIGSTRIATSNSSANGILVRYSTTVGTTTLEDVAGTTETFLWSYETERLVLKTAEPVTPTPTPTPAAPSRTAVLIGYGQSNMRGTNSSALSAPAYRNTMFDGGVLTQGLSVAARSKVRAIAEAAATSGLSWAAAYAVELEMASRVVASFDAIRHRYFAACPAQNGAAIQYLMEGGSYWPAARDDLRLAGQALVADEQIPHFAAIAWVHGFANQSTARADYAAALRAIFASATRIAGPTLGGKPLLIAAQMPFHIRGGTAVLPQTPLAVLDVAADVGGAVFPLYPAEWGDDGIHMTQRGHVYKGLMIGKLLYDMTQGAFYEPLRMQSVAWGASALTVTLAGGNGSYAFDTSAMPAVPNMGFDLYSAGGTLIDGVITGVSLSGATVTIGINRPVAAGERLVYGYGRNGFVNPTNAAPGPYTLGNLRDTDPRTRDAAGVTHRLWNWCVIHEVVRP